jgi:hypothetical protein
MGLFAFLDGFEPDNAANVTAALGSLFGVLGALVGAYFGIKASSDAQDSSAATAKQAVQDQKETAQRSVEVQKDCVMPNARRISPNKPATLSLLTPAVLQKWHRSPM